MKKVLLILLLLLVTVFGGCLTEKEEKEEKEVNLSTSEKLSKILEDYYENQKIMRLRGEDSGINDGLYSKIEGENYFYQFAIIKELELRELMVLVNSVEQKPAETYVVMNKNYVSFKEYDGIESVATPAEEVLEVTTEVFSVGEGKYKQANGDYHLPEIIKEVRSNCVGEVVLEKINFKEYNITIILDSIKNVDKLIFENLNGGINPSEITVEGNRVSKKIYVENSEEIKIKPMNANGEKAGNVYVKDLSEEYIALEGISITIPVAKLSYFTGDELNITGLEVTGTYSDGSTKVETVTAENISGFDSETAEMKTVVITIEEKTASYDVEVKKIMLENIEITSSASKSNYFIEEELDLAGLEITGTYSNGRIKVETVTVENISGFDSKASGTKELTITIDGKTTRYSVEVEEVRLESIVITKKASKLTYLLGEKLDITELEVTGVYNNRSTRVQAITVENISGFDSKTAGTKKLAITVAGKIASYNVEVKEIVLESIAITNLASKLNYFIGEDLDVTGLELIGSYSDGSVKEESITIENISGFDSSTLGIKTLVITLNGKTASYEIEIKEVVLESIAITREAIKLIFFVRDSLYIGGLRVTGTYSDGSTKLETISKSNVTGFDSSSSGLKTLVITVDGKTISYEIEVKEIVLESILVTNSADKLIYFVGDELDLAGLEITGTYNNNAKKIEIVTMENISEFNSSTAGTKRVVITLEGKTTSYDVKVIDLPEMVLVPAGVTSEENKSITVVNDFYLGKYEVTQDQWETVMIGNRNAISIRPSYFTGDNLGNHPVDKVSWYSAIVFCNRLSIIEGLTPVYSINGSTNPDNWGAVPTDDNDTWDNVEVSDSSKAYRLPIKDEWEYAGRGGKNASYTKYSGSNTIEDVAWYNENAYHVGKSHPDYGTHPVGQKSANELGVYDMSGNVYEWSYDLSNLEENKRIGHGGAWNSFSGFVMPGHMAISNPYSNSWTKGLRLAKTEGDRILSRIAIGKEANKLIYFVGDISLDMTGLEVIGTYSDGSTSVERVRRIDISGFDTSSTGIKTLVITLNGKTTSYTIEVKEIDLESIELTKLPNKLNYSIGDKLDITGLEVKVRYSNGKIEVKKVTIENISGFDSGTAGTKTLTITIGGKTVSYKVDIVELNFEMILLPAGTTSEENGSISVDYNFYIGKYEVTQSQWELVMEGNINGISPRPSYFTGESLAHNPVEKVSWYGTIVFCNRLSIMEGLTPVYSMNGSSNPDDWGVYDETWDNVEIKNSSKGYRLPTMNDWEYAARGGKGGIASVYSGSNALGDVAWYKANDFDLGTSHPYYGTHPVGEKAPNELGIYDLSGNVYEWCYEKSDLSEGNVRAAQGGAWNTDISLCGIGSTWNQSPYSNPASHGLRLVRTEEYVRVSRIEITKEPDNKYNYLTGDELDITGIEVTGTYGDGRAEVKTITMVNISGFDSNVSGYQTVVITVDGKTDTYKVKVSGLAELEIRKAPLQTRYFVGDELDIIGLEVKGRYENYKYRDEIITMKNISGFESSTIGTKTVIITVGDTSTSYNVEVIESGHNMILVPAGTTSEENGNINVNKDFYIGMYEVTSEKWEALMAGNKNEIELKPSFHGGYDNYALDKPVENVSWNAVMVFCNRLSIKEGLTPVYSINGSTNPDNWGSESKISVFDDDPWVKEMNDNVNGYRLPTSNEWEYAARGGKDGISTIYSGSNIIDEVAWYRGQNGDELLPVETTMYCVGEKAPNELGIYDMSGNVYEWCYSVDSLEGYVWRGGSFDSTADNSEISKIIKHISYKNISTGFRIVRNK